MEQATPTSSAGKPEAIEPGEQIHVAGDKPEVGQHHIAADHDGSEIKQGSQEEHHPWTILEQIGEVLAEIGLLLRVRLDALFGGEEGMMKKITLRADSNPS